MLYDPRGIMHRVDGPAVAALRSGRILILEACTPRQLERATGGPPSSDLLVESEALRLELEGLELLALEEKRRWIEEGADHRGESAVVQAAGGKPAKGDDRSRGDCRKPHNVSMLIAVGG